MRNMEPVQANVRELRHIDLHLYKAQMSFELQVPSLNTLLVLPDLALLDQLPHVEFLQLLNHQRHKDVHCAVVSGAPLLLG